MKIIIIEAGEKDVYVKLRNKNKKERFYELQSSGKKNSAQLVKATKIK